MNLMHSSSHPPKKKTLIDFVGEAGATYFIFIFHMKKIKIAKKIIKKLVAILSDIKYIIT